jgi:MFS family permease
VNAPSPFRLAIFWLGIQAVWGALLAISLQARTTELVPGSALVAFGYLATAGAVVAAVVQIVVGPWSDARRRNGSRRIEFYAFGAVAGTVAIVAFYQAHTFTALAIAFVAVQAGLNVAIGPYQAIVPDFVDRKRFGIASSWMAALQSVGNAAGAICASFIRDAIALPATLSALLLGTFAVTWYHVRGLPLQAQAAQSQGVRITRPFVDLFVSRVLVYLGFYTLLDYLFFYVSRVLGAPTIDAAQRWSALLVLTFTLVGAAGAAAAARPSDRFDKRAVATAGGITMSLALTIFILTHSLAGAAAATVVAGLGWGVFLVADWAIACRVLPPGSLATTMGIWNVAVIAPQIIAPALTTAVLLRLSVSTTSYGPRWAFGLAVGETLLGIAWLWRLSHSVVGE